MLEDILTIGLKSNLLKGLVNKLLTKALREKTGPGTDVTINDFEMDLINGQVIVHLDTDVIVDKDYVEGLVKDQLKSRDKNKDYNDQKGRSHSM